jgi:hypothetical protein
VLLGCLAVSATEAPVVTAASLLESEPFWPYKVKLTDAFVPPGRAQPLKAGQQGVLIRVQPGGLARIDFSTRGKFPVPIDKTDLVENANRIRRGEIAKELPNFVYAIGARLVDTEAETLRGLPHDLFADRPGFLCVFADPSDEGFPALAEALAPLRDKNGVVTLLFPQGTHDDGDVRDKLHALHWTVPFVYDFLSEPYTRTLLDEGTPMPTVLLQTSEGRVLFQDEFSPAAVARLSAALDANFHGSTSVAGTTSGSAQ